MDSVRGAGHRMLVGSGLLLAPPACPGPVEKRRNADGGFDLRGSELLHLRSGSGHPRIASRRIIANKVANAPGDPGTFTLSSIVVEGELISAVKIHSVQFLWTAAT